MNQGIVTQGTELPLMPMGLTQNASLPPPMPRTVRDIEPEARDYALRVAAADGEPMIDQVVRGVSNFVRGCKEDNTWSAIQVCCLLMGARTLAGALTPLVGVAPSNINFVNADYNRRIGLTGNGVTKHLNTNYSTSADPSTDFHAAVNFLAPSTLISGFPIGSVLMGGRSPSGNSTGSKRIGVTSGQASGVLRGIFAATPATDVEGTGGYFTYGSRSLAGIARNRVTSGEQRLHLASSGFFQSASATPASTNFFVFALSENGSVNLRYPGTISFYSAGRYLWLPSLDRRVADLFAAIANAP